LHAELQSLVVHKTCRGCSLVRAFQTPVIKQLESRTTSTAGGLIPFFQHVPGSECAVAGVATVELAVSVDILTAQTLPAPALAFSQEPLTPTLSPAKPQKRGLSESPRDRLLCIQAEPNPHAGIHSRECGSVLVNLAKNRSMRRSLTDAERRRTALPKIAVTPRRTK
jgi:hypothetical protein